MSNTNDQQSGDTANPPTSDGPNAGTSNKKKKNNKNKQKKQNTGNRNNNNGIKFEGNLTSGALTGVVLDDATKLVDNLKTFIDALYQHVSVDGGQLEWTDTIKLLKKPKVGELFKQKTMDPIRDNWGDIVELPIRDKNGNILKEENGNKLVNKIIRALDPVKRDSLKVEYKSDNKYINKKKNQHIEYKKQLVVMIKSQLGPSIKSLFQLKDEFKAASIYKDTINLLCATREACYDSIVGSKPLMESLKVLRTLLNFKQKGELALYAKKLSS